MELNNQTESFENKIEEVFLLDLFPAYKTVEGRTWNPAIRLEVEGKRKGDFTEMPFTTREFLGKISWVVFVKAKIVFQTIDAKIKSLTSTGNIIFIISLSFPV